jgi:PAS domain S-box-containing protein
MKVRSKTLLITLTAVLCIVIVFTSVTSTVLVDNFDDLETSNTEMTAERVKDHLEADIDSLEGSTMVYAYWNVTYQYAMGENSEYAYSAIPDSTYENLEINAIIILNQSGNILYKLAYEKDKGEMFLPRGWLDHLEPDDMLVTHNYSMGGISGLIEVQGDIYELSAMPILKNDQTGPIAGTFIMAKQIDEGYISSISHQVSFPIEMYLFDDAEPVPGLGTDWVDEFSSDEVMAIAIDDEVVDGFTAMEDIYGERLVLLQVEMPRDMYQHAMESQNFVLGFLLIVGIILALLTAYLLEVFVLSRLNRLDRDVKRIGGGGSKHRVDGEGDDELGSLAGSINEMLETIESSQRQLLDSEKRYKAVVEDQTEMIFRTRPDNGVTFANDAFWEYFGIDEDERKTVYSPLFRDSKRIIQNRISKLTPDNPVQEYEHSITRSDGEERWVQWTIRGIFDEGELEEVQWVGRDVTDKMRLLEKLNKSEKIESLGVLAGGIAHDFNNMLTSIMATLNLMREEIGPDDPNYHKIEEGERSVMRATELTKQLLTFSRGGEPIKRVIELQAFIKETAEFSTRGTGITLEMDLDEDLCPVEADEGQLLQVISNLIINARQAMPEGGMITVSGRNCSIDEESGLPLPPGRYTVISIEDRGMGIPQENLNRIFDPYFTTKKKGSGLGLSITHSIIVKHGGYIEVSSVLNKGTRFTIYLPSTEKPVCSMTESRSISSPTTGSILIMDDEEDILSVLSQLLTARGYRVECATRGEEAIPMYEKALDEGRPYDLVIMDLTIKGGLGGKEAIQELRRIDPFVTAIVSSGYSNDPVMANYRDYGFSAVVEKPYRIKDMIGKIQGLIPNPDLDQDDIGERGVNGSSASS